MPNKPEPPAVDEYTQRYHALALATGAQLPYKNADAILEAARKFHAYLTGQTK